VWFVVEGVFGVYFDDWYGLVLFIDDWFFGGEGLVWVFLLKVEVFDECGLCWLFMVVGGFVLMLGA